MQGYEIIHTSPGADTFVLFEKVVAHIYTDSILALKNREGINASFLNQTFVLLHHQEAIGRCCLYVNPNLSYANRKVACLGNFEMIKDMPAATYFLDYVFKYAKTNGFDYLIGPMNGSTWDTYRLATDYESPCFFLEPYYPNYYSDLFLNAGFEKIARYVSNEDREQELNEARIEKIEGRFAAQGIEFRTINLTHFEQELDKLYDFCMLSFKSNFLFTPINRESFKEKYLKLKPYIKPEYVIISEDKDKNMVGLIFCIENYTDKNEKGMIIKTIAKHPSMRYAGMGNALGTRFKKKALADGYSYFIHAFMIETNASKSLSNYFSGRTIREYYLYGKPL